MRPGRDPITIRVQEYSGKIESRNRIIDVQIMGLVVIKIENLMGCYVGKCEE